MGLPLGNLEGTLTAPAPPPLLRRKARVRTVLDTVAIEGNPLSLEQATVVLSGKRVLGAAKDIREIQNANAAYDNLPTRDPLRQRSLG